MPRAKNTVYCVPSDDTVIDKVEMASPNTYSDIRDYDKDVWIIMALRNSTHAYLLQRSVNS